MSTPVSELMRTLVKRYNIPTRPVLAPAEQTPSLAQTQFSHNQNASATQQKLDVLMLKLESNQRENDSLREKLKSKEA